jgi:hypothetical protein
MPMALITYKLGLYTIPSIHKLQCKSSCACYLREAHICRCHMTLLCHATV